MGKAELPWRPFLWTLAILCLVYLPLFTGQIIFFRDIAHWGFPARAFLRASLLHGELPAWNPYQGLGFPVAADPLYGVFYPPNWLFLLAPRGWVASLYNWQCFLHMAWGALGLCLLARRLGASSPAVVVGGLAFALSGYLTSQWSSGLLLFADAWVPWAAVGHLALVDDMAAGKAWRGVAKAALPTACACLFGEIFLAMIGAGFGIACAAVVRATEAPRLGRPSWSRWLGCVAATVALAFAVGAAVILPASLLVGTTERAAPLSRDLAEVCSLHPLRVLEMIAPGSMGDAYSLFPAAPVIGEPRLDGLPLSYSMYLGASVVALALAACGRGRRLASGLGGLALLALLVAFGRHAPVHAVLRFIARPLAYMRYPEKYTIVVVTVAALLAALGTERVLDKTAQARQPWRRSAGLLLVLVMLASLSTKILPGPWLAFALHGAVMGALAVAALLAIQFLAARRSRAVPFLLPAVVALDLALAAWPLQTFAPRQLASEPPPVADRILQGRPATDPPPRIYRSNQTSDAVNRWLPTRTNAETEAKLGQTLITNTANVWGIATLPGYDAAIPASLDGVWSRGLAVGQSALRLLGAEYAILPVSSPDPSADEHPGLVPILDPLPGARLYAVPNTLPRVFWARHAEVLSDDEALARLFEPAVVAGASVYLAPESHISPRPAPAGRAGTCTLAAYGDRRIVADCVGDQPGVVVFVEQFARGWRATVDGLPAPIARANLVMRGIALGPGSHRIVLDYATPGLAAGLAISGLGLVLLLGLLVYPSKMPSLPS